MSKSNKELAVEVAIGYIQANPRTTYKNDNQLVQSLSLESIANIIKGVHQVLEEIDKKAYK
ncbi:hypothetical protein EEL32_12085 [Brevibacillus laterosporus]|nr:hypothetical protein EEL32_12085 [Brevibacillus laterosporus]